MASIDELVAVQEVRAKRRKSVLDAFDALTQDDQDAVLAEIVHRVRQRSVQAPSKAGTSVAREEPTFLTKAVAFIQNHPEGVSARQVSDAIGQKPGPTDSTLRYADKRGLIVHSGRLWYPTKEAAASAEVSEKKLTSRALVLKALTQASRQMTAGDILAAVATLEPRANPQSVRSEMSDMVADKLLTYSEGVGPKGSSLYGLADGGHSPAS